MFQVKVVTVLLCFVCGRNNVRFTLLLQWSIAEQVYLVTYDSRSFKVVGGQLRRSFGHCCETVRRLPWEILKRNATYLRVERPPSTIASLYSTALSIDFIKKLRLLVIEYYPVREYFLHIKWSPSLFHSFLLSEDVEYLLR